MSHLDNGFRSLTLQRFPATDDVNPLQAWEAADEYLLQQLDDTEIRGPVLILNDAFGALSCALAEHKPYSIGDSGNDSNLLIVFYVQIMPDDFVMQLHRF